MAKTEDIRLAKGHNTSMPQPLTVFKQPIVDIALLCNRMEDDDLLKTLAFFVIVDRKLNKCMFFLCCFTFDDNVLLRNVTRFLRTAPDARDALLSTRSVSLVRVYLLMK